MKESLLIFTFGYILPQHNLIYLLYYISALLIIPSPFPKPLHIHLHQLRIAPRDLRQELNRLIRLCKLLSEHPILHFQVLNELIPRVLIPHRLVRYIGGPSRILEGAYVLIQVGVAGVETGNHQAVGVAAQTLLEEASQLGVAVRDVDLTARLGGGGVQSALLLAVVGEGRDYLS